MRGVQRKPRLEKGQKKQGLAARDGMIISQHLSPTATHQRPRPRFMFCRAWSSLTSHWKVNPAAFTSSLLLFSSLLFLRYSFSSCSRTSHILLDYTRLSFPSFQLRTRPLFPLPLFPLPPSLSFNSHSLAIVRCTARSSSQDGRPPKETIRALRDAGPRPASTSYNLALQQPRLCRATYRREHRGAALWSNDHQLERREGRGEAVG